MLPIRKPFTLNCSKKGLTVFVNRILFTFFSFTSGENLVRGDKECITNLLEIFDGLLEYLNEEISEELHNGGRERS